MAVVTNAVRLFARLTIVVTLLSTAAQADTDTVNSRWIDLSQNGSAADRARGLVSIPQNNYGDLPAILLIGDCRRPQPFQKTWAHRLASLGYVTFLIDPATRGKTETLCRSGAFSSAFISAAKSYLDELDNITIDQIAVVSWDYHLPPTLGPVASEISAAVSFYPTCSNTYELRQSFPQLLFETGDNPDSACISNASMANVVGGEIQVRVYPDTRHRFDDPNAGLHRAGSRDVDIYNRAAHQDAIIRVEMFLNEHLQVTLAQPYPSKAFSPLPPKLDRDDTPHVTTGYGTWTHDPTDPGPNTPPVGRSVFDLVFSKQTGGGVVYDLPDSYEGIVQHISRFVTIDRRGLKPVKQVLIPHGRSLQREAAAPHYYQHPRIVAAVDGEPTNSWSRPPIFLKDRLFLGYHETAQVLEVISYNEDAARFEFQVVNNFGPGLEPDILYADRQLCTSCHQNGAPLFPREDWQETNGSIDTNNALEKVMSSYHGVQVERSGEIPAKIDISTDRANLLPVLQRLWRDGCGPSKEAGSNECRAFAFQAMLQYRLSNDNSFDRNQAEFHKGYTQHLTERWREMWPNGLYISNSDIPDRNPTRDASIFGLRDPLTPRVPMEIWNGYKKSDLERMIVAMAEDIPLRDIERLDQWLVKQHTPRADNRSRLTAHCTLRRQLRRGLAFPVKVDCQGDELGLSGALTDWGPGPVFGEITDIRAAGFEIRDRETLLPAKTPSVNSKAFRIILDDRSMRLPDGRRLSNLTLTLEQNHLGNEAGAKAVLTLDDDFQVVRETLTQMAPVDFASKPFHAPRMLSQLFKNLGADYQIWCCDPNTPAPPIKLDEPQEPVEAVASLNRLAPARILDRFCARCHRTQNKVPPNFLFGRKQAVSDTLDHCAPRIDYRLAMWDVPIDERTRSPMPPESALPSFGLSKTEWRNSPELKTLRRYIKTLIATERDPSVAYDQLRNCLPEHEQARAEN